MKKLKKAWVRYDEDPKTGAETYTLLTWDDKECAWKTDMVSPFVADASDPDGPTDYIRYDLLMRVISLARKGYELDI